jgi:hypothetical protein
MQAIINRRLYNTDTATLLAGDDCKESGRCQTFLYRTPKGAYFATHLAASPFERDSLEPLTLDEALELYWRLPERPQEFEDAFPGVELEEA